MAPNNSKIVSEPNKIDDNGLEKMEMIKGNLIRKMYSFMENDVFCDITLIAGVDNFKMRAHKTVLAASCDYFNGMFCGLYKDSEDQEIVMNDFDGDSLKSFIHYFYTGQMELKKDNLVEIGILSDQYHIPKVLNQCYTSMKSIINDENCTEFFDHRDLHYLKDFYLFVTDYINRQFQSVKESENFLNLSYDGMKKILRSDELNVSSEEDVVFAFVYWIEKDFESRREHIKDLLPLIRMTLLTPKFIQEYIQPLYEMAKDPALSTIIMDALYWHNLPDKSNISVQYPNPRRLQDNLLIITKIKGESTQNVYSYLSFPKKLNLVTQLKDVYNFISLNKNEMIVIDKNSFRMISVDTNDETKFFYPDHQNWEFENCYGLMIKNEFYTTYEKSVTYIIAHHEILCNHSFKKYNFAKKQWTLIKSGFNRQVTAMVHLDEHIYFMFGENDSCTSFMTYNTSTKEWSIIEQVKRVVMINKPIAFNGTIYALVKNADGLQSLNQLDTTIGVWRQVSVLPDGLCDDLHLINFNNSIHLVAALDDTYTMFQYESASNKWKNLFNLNIVGDLDSIVITSHNFDY